MEVDGAVEACQYPLILSVESQIQWTCKIGKVSTGFVLDGVSSGWLEYKLSIPSLQFSFATSFHDGM